MTAAKLADQVGDRAAWGIVDQGISSLTNFALAVFVARSVSAPEFGAFAIVLALYLVAVGLEQAVASLPLAIRYSAATREQFGTTVSAATGAAVLVGLSGAIVLLIASLLAAPILAAPVLVLAITLPGLMLQDAWRFCFLAQGRPRAAVLNDGVWALCQSLGFAVLLALRRHGTAEFVAAWGIAATISAALGCLQARAVPSLRQAHHWLVGQQDLIIRYVGESLLVRGASQASLGLVALIAGLAALGGLRGAQVLFSPLNLLYQSAFFVGVPEGVRELHRGGRGFSRLMIGISFGCAAIAALWAIPILMLPAPIGHQFLGSTWLTAAAFVLPVAVQNGAIGASMGPQIGLRSLAAAGTSLKVQLIYSALVLSLTGVGAWLAGGIGAAGGIAAATLLTDIVWFRAFLHFAKQANPMPHLRSISHAPNP